MSGGERSLLILIASLPADVRPLLAAPRGSLLAAAADLGIPTSEIRGTAGSLRLHPLHTPKAVAEMTIAAVQVERAARRHRATVVHANSIRAGIIAGLLGPAGGAARVVHVRDCLPEGIASTATSQMIAATARVVVANSAYTAASVSEVAPRARVTVVHNPVDLARFDPARIDRDQARMRLGPALAERVLLGVVAQITPWKGQRTAIEALALLRSEGVDAHLLLIGSAKFVARATRFDNEAYVAELRALIAEAGLADHVSWLGEREDVPELVRALDVLLLPSEEEPFGRALIEAMALEVPVVATSVGGPREIIEEGREGYLVPPAEPAAWARAIRRILERDDRGAGMGRAGRERVERSFGSDHHLQAMLEVYRRAAA